MTTKIKKRHRKLTSQDRITIAHTIGGSTFFKVGEDEKKVIKIDSLTKPITPPEMPVGFKLCCTIL